ncbi:hypothetical protein D9758_006696 [Tetrapyrgos nigripes]|uniref:Glycoside hydrolase family 95 protein n=1 Tax=Tetrapyrgos nigripes TaxID=182062 RepID=A0A8H5GJ42_9AGAR|nr:hypothetical protein D9758_006696 [Tetrapyrgos nigripes]
MLLKLSALTFWGVVAHMKSVLTSPSTTMWFNRSEIIPIGNGRLGAMLLGQFPDEVIPLNEDRIWSGSVNDSNNKNCPGALPQIQEFIWQDDLQSAQDMVTDNCMATPLGQQMFQTAGNLILTFPSASISNFNHSLDLTTALATTIYTANGVQFTREAFATNPDNDIVMRFSANESAHVAFTAGFVTPMTDPTVSTSSNILKLTAMGQTVSGLVGYINFVVEVEVTVSGSNATILSGDQTLEVSGADEALMVIAIDTNYIRYDDITGDPQSKVDSTLSAVRGKSFDEILKTHLSDYQPLFSRVSISLGTPSSNSFLPTDLRKNLPGGADVDQDVFSLYTQFGRYLGIALQGTRKLQICKVSGTLLRILAGAANILSTSISRYIILPFVSSENLKTSFFQMNSWLCEPLNIAETLDPLWNLLKDMAERGATTAAEEYNIHRGWVAHHNIGI